MIQSALIFGSAVNMKRAVDSTKKAARARGALRNRVRQFYLRFNAADWEGCYALVDPELVRQGKVASEAYSESLKVFKGVYGKLWQDENHGFHMFRERWINESGHLYTRLVWLVPNNREIEHRQG
jgi:hypothetical protein